MIKFVASILLSAALMAAEIPGTADTAKTRAWLSMSEAQRLEADIEYKAAACGLSVETFNLLSRTIEAESDRSDNLEGRVLIALTILNRVDSASPTLTRAGITLLLPTTKGGLIMDNLRKLKETLEAISKECENTTSEECSKCKYSNNGFCINAPYNWELDEIERFLAKKEGKL